MESIKQTALVLGEIQKEKRLETKHSAPNFENTSRKFFLLDVLDFFYIVLIFDFLQVESLTERIELNL